MKKVRPVVARNARELAKVLGLAPADGMEIEFRSDLNDKIIEVVAKKGLTHADVARRQNQVSFSFRSAHLDIFESHRFSSVLNDSSTRRSRSWSGGKPTKFRNTSSLQYSRTR